MISCRALELQKAGLEDVYHRYNKRKYVAPDPLQFLYSYPDARDREIAGLLASALAYGRVSQILRSVESVLTSVGRAPRAFVLGSSERCLKSTFAGFAHRFTGCGDLVDLIRSVGNAVSEYGSLNECFLAGLRSSEDDMFAALRVFAEKLRAGNRAGTRCLIPDPAKGSACKRLNLFLRWMVRKDAVDPGGWSGVSRSRLIVPLDTHMAGIARRLGWTSRSSPDMKMALDVTRHFSLFAPRDPVKYDFALTRFGIRRELDTESLVRALC